MKIEVFTGGQHRSFEYEEFDLDKAAEHFLVEAAPEDASVCTDSGALVEEVERRIGFLVGNRYRQIEAELEFHWMEWIGVGPYDRQLAELFFAEENAE